MDIWWIQIIVFMILMFFIIAIINWLHQKIGYFLFLIIYLPIVFFVIKSVNSINPNSSVGSIIATVVLSFFVVAFIYEWLLDTPEKEQMRKEQEKIRAEEKEQKKLKKERWQTKKCAWCGCIFYWAESGCRWHCCRRCEAQDRG